MTIQRTNPRLLLPITFYLTTLLTACGGGGGTPPGSTLYTATCSDGTMQVSTLSLADATAACIVATAVYPSSIVTSVPADTYNAVTQAEEKAAFALLNAERSACGFGKLAQNTMLDTATKNHGDWLHINSSTTHEEVFGTAGFTGVTHNNRIANGGYAAVKSGEVLNGKGGPSESGKGVASVRTLLAGPYHAIEMLSEYTDVGVAVRNITDASAPVGVMNNVWTTMNFGYTSAASYQAPASSDVLTYPCQGTAGVDYSLGGETPNPVPGRLLHASPVGQPTVIMVRKGRVLTISSATMTKVSTGTAITLRTPVTSATDPNGSGYYAGNFGYVLPDAALEPSTQYQVTVTGLSGATAFSRTFTFTTGAVNY